MSKERWKDVVGYEGLYQVSSCGRMKSFIRKGSRINIAQIDCARQLLKDGVKQSEIEIMTGLSESTIYRIKYNKNDYN